MSSEKSRRGWLIGALLLFNGVSSWGLPARGGRGEVAIEIRAGRATAEQICANAGRAIAAGRLDTAIAELRDAAERFPRDTQIQFNLGLALSRRGRFEEAIQSLRRAAGDPVFSGEAHFLLAADYFESKKYQEAVGELNGLEKTERALYLLEESERRTGHATEAKAAFHALITQYPDSAWTHYLMGNAYEDQQQLEKAIEEYKQAVSRDATVPNASFAIGYLYWRQQDNENAREWLEKETRQGCHGLANYYLGEIARSEKDMPKAKVFYGRAIQCDGSSSEAHLRLGMVLEEEKRYTSAVDYLKKAILLDPKGSSAHYHLAAVYRALGRQADSQAEFGKVREIQAAKENGGESTGPPKQ